MFDKRLKFIITINMYVDSTLRGGMNIYIKYKYCIKYNFAHKYVHMTYMYITFFTEIYIAHAVMTGK